MTPLVAFGSKGSSGLENNIAYYVSGKSNTQVSDIRLKVNVNNPSERREAQRRLEIATSALFKSLSQPIPAQLQRALASLKPTSATAAFGQVDLAAEPGRIESFKVVITPEAAVRADIALKAASSSEFDKCLSVVSQAAGYSPSELRGDGKPVQEQGYKSFLVNGRGKDMFFCEIHAAGRYKVKAAIGGKFPFQHIAEGRL